MGFLALVGRLELGEHIFLLSMIGYKALASRRLAVGSWDP